MIYDLSYSWGILLIPYFNIIGLQKTDEFSYELQLQQFLFFDMGNSQTSKKQSCNVQTIDLPKVQAQQEIPKQLNFVSEIQHQNVKNVNQRKSSNDSIVQTLQPKASKKNLSNKDLPPLKIRKSIGIPLGSSSSINKIQNVTQDFQLVNCERNKRTQMKNNVQQIEGNQENATIVIESKQQISSKNIRAKKFRPSQQNKKSSLSHNNQQMLA